MEIEHLLSDRLLDMFLKRVLEGTYYNNKTKNKEHITKKNNLLTKFIQCIAHIMLLVFADMYKFFITISDFIFDYFLS